jgi:predicted RNase H-like HicB family nuclease
VIFFLLTGKTNKKVTMNDKSPQPHTFTVLIEKDEDGYYVASVPALKGCYTQAKTLEELYPRVKEVIELCLEEEPVHMKLSLFSRWKWCFEGLQWERCRPLLQR